MAEFREYTKKDIELPEDYREIPAEEKIEDGVVMRTLFFELSEEDRLIISMHLFAGYTSKEIAKLLGINENTVRSKESRALKKLARMVELES